MQRLLYFALACVLTAGATADAQEPAPAPPLVEDHIFIHAEAHETLEPAEAPMPIEAGVELLGFEGGHGRRVVKGAPFSATAVTERTQLLADGNRISRTTSVALFRDSEGRFRREVTLPAIGPLAASGKSPRFISISDPVAGARYMLHPDEKTAHKLTRGAREHRFHGERFQKRVPGPESEGNLQKEQLGTQMIEGVSAEGTRVTRTVPAGQIGNEKPIVVVSERWYSPELQMVVMTKRSDPRFGTTTYQLTKIQRTEPSPSLFEVPSDYTVKEGRGGFGKRKRMRDHRPRPVLAPLAPDDEL